LYTLHAYLQPIDFFYDNDQEVVKFTNPLVV